MSEPEDKRSGKERFQEYFGFELSDEEIERVEAVYKKIEEEYLKSQEVK